MAKLNFGGVEEEVVTREEFPLEKAREVLMEVPLLRNRSLYYDVRAKYNATKVMIGRGGFHSGTIA